MKTRTWMSITAITLFAALAIPIRLAAQEKQSQNEKTTHHQYIFVEVPTFGGPNFIANFTGVPNKLLNNDGTFTGAADTSITDPYCFGSPDCFVEHAFQWRDGIMTDLGALPGGANSNAFGINARGVITGLSENGLIDPLLVSSFFCCQEFRAVVWKHGQIIDLGTLGGNSSLAQAINNRGQVVGIAWNSIPDPISLFGFYVGTQTRAFLWEKGAMQDLGTLGGPDAWALFVNERGQVAGPSFTNSVINPATGQPTTHPFLWEDGKMIDLGSLGGTLTFTNGLNNRGQVVGTSNLAGDSTAHPFLWDRGSLLDLGTLGGSGAGADALNDDGVIVGGSTTQNDQTILAFMWKKGVMTNLGTLPGGDFSFAQGINSRGQIVGASTSFPGGPTSATLWENGSVTDLNTFVPPGSVLHLIGDDMKINDQGEIAGRGVLPNGDSRAFLLIPCDGDNADDEDCQHGDEGGAAVTQSHPSPVGQTSTAVAHGNLTPETLAAIRARLARRFPYRGLGVRPPK